MNNAHTFFILAHPKSEGYVHSLTTTKIFTIKYKILLLISIILPRLFRHNQAFFPHASPSITEYVFFSMSLQSQLSIISHASQAPTSILSHAYLDTYKHSFVRPLQAHGITNLRLRCCSYMHASKMHTNVAKNDSSLVI